VEKFNFVQIYYCDAQLPERGNSLLVRVTSGDPLALIPAVVVPLSLADRSSSLPRIDRVINSGWFVLGPEVDAFETEFAAVSGAPNAVATGNGTDALAIVLRALDIGPGDEVITTPLSAAYTALAVVMVGARPVFADIDSDRLTLDPRAADAATPNPAPTDKVTTSTDRLSYESRGLAYARGSRRPSGDHAHEGTDDRTAAGAACTPACAG